ncbi:MAG: DUF4886 domain-containing protein, partial [Kiritimatiellae bacterium]|nr:DUF4886 domain-containing protein [Kiritimatiellia bacterium]
MKKIGLMVAGALCAVVAFGEVAADETAKKPDSLKVLMIGNSFSICVGSQMPQIAKSLGLNLELGSLYIGGCPLEKHWANWVASTNANFKPYVFDLHVNGKKVRHEKMNLRTAVSLAKWDVVTFQQASGLSWIANSYHPYAERLQEAIRAQLPDAEFVWQETWSYLPWDPNFKRWKIDRDEMYARLHRAYADAAAANNQRVIPTGTAIQLFRQKLPVKPTENSIGGDVCGSSSSFKKKDDGSYVYKGDTIHLNGDGHYLQALVWTAKLFGVDVRKCDYAPTWIAPEKVALMKEVAMAAVGGEMPKMRDAASEGVQRLGFNGFDEAKMGIGLGGEFPGAIAGLLRTNDVVRFNFDFTKGGNYVTMRLGQIYEGARSVSCQCRLMCSEKANFWIRASDAKGDVYLIAKPTLASMGGWQAVTHDLRRLGWCRGKSTNKVDRATVKWPISAEILVEPHQRKLKGYVEMKDLVLATTNRVSQKDWAFSCGASRFGQVYLPDEVIAVKASLKSLRTDGAEPTMRLEKAVVTDWQDKEVLVKKCSGDITLTADELKGQFGAFRVTFWGRDQVGEKKLGETWFARLTGESKPVTWAGTGVHGWSTDTRRYELIAKAGLGTVRNDIPGWSGWEKEKGVYQCPRGFRETIDKMHSLGIEMNLILNSLNPLYGKMLDFDAFCNWVRYVVTHEGKDVEYYEIWNEPNNFYFGPKLRNSFFDSFTKFTKQVVKTIREVKP